MVRRVQIVGASRQHLEGRRCVERGHFIDVDVEAHLDGSAFKINDLPYFAGFKDGKLIEEFATAKKDKVTELANAVAS